MLFTISSFNLRLNQREDNTTVNCSSAAEAVARAERSGCCGRYATDIQARPLTEAETEEFNRHMDDGDDAYGGPNHDI